MITYDHIMVRFGELSTKGKNKKEFISILFFNIKHALKEFPDVSVSSRYDHIYVHLNGHEVEPVISRLQDVSGIQALSLVYKCENDIEVIKSSSDACFKVIEAFAYGIGKVFISLTDLFSKIFICMCISSPTSA